MAPPWNAHVIKTLTEGNIYIYIYMFIYISFFLHLTYQLNVTSINSLQRIRRNHSIRVQRLVVLRQKDCTFLPSILSPRLK